MATSRVTAEEIEDALSQEGDAQLPQYVQDHLPRASAAAERNLNLLIEKRGRTLDELNAQLGQVFSASTPKANRLPRVRFIAGQWSQTVFEHAACRHGCSHCCHVNTAVSRQEAELIAKATGSQMNRSAPTYRAETAPQRDDFFGVPCTFLKAGKCSIYEHRPLACRTLLNLDDDDTLCRLVKDVAIPVPYANAMQLQMAYVRATGLQEWADVRQWFPQPKT